MNPNSSVFSAKTVRRFALLKEHMVGLESDTHRTIGEQSDVVLVQTEQKRVRGDAGV